MQNKPRYMQENGKPIGLLFTSLVQNIMLLIM